MHYHKFPEWAFRYLGRAILLYGIRMCRDEPCDLWIRYLSSKLVGIEERLSDRYTSRETEGLA